jgi:hypothetical protein
MTSPYAGLDARAFWRSAAADPSRDLYRKKFDINPQDTLVTAGSCFAQHIARTLRRRGYNVFDAEPAPPMLPESSASRFGYNLYSARYGNIYTAHQLLQLFREAFGRFEPKNWIWQKGDRYFDALRPNVEPNGLISQDEVIAHRTAHLSAVRLLLKKVDVFVFTFGLTEAWRDKESGTVYPTAPETIAGTFDPATFEFVNFTFNEIYDDFLLVRKIIQLRRPNAKFVLTVSPVPLTATASGDHVLAATIYSKSVLRAVAGQLAMSFDDIDYFPSYELIAGHPTQAAYYESNLRAVSGEGVAAAMSAFVSQHVAEEALPGRKVAQPVAGDSQQADKSAQSPGNARKRKKRQRDVVCEDLLLEAFSR